MKILNCQTMRIAVILSMLIFSAGVMLQIPAMVSLFDQKFFEVILAFLGMLGMFVSVALAVIVAIFSLFPETSKHLKLCEH